eukprot:TRINITY_DN28_c0_g1_i1.p1 TRINITY_DN28_c0_g1~~TRINITY_DN28_c0_g1_i1.p1  ORF type:complete len:618 (+),score=139.06 TRINITY_DN28_c0_g1_i1:276-2129(+)
MAQMVYRAPRLESPPRSPPPSQILQEGNEPLPSGNSVLDDHVSIWYELRKYDPANTGLVDTNSFRKAMDDVGLRLGSKEADRIISSLNFLSDGYVDYLKLGEEVGHMLKAMESYSPYVHSQQHRHDPGFVIPLHNTIDSVSLPDEKMQVIGLKLKEKVYSVQDKIYDSFCKFDRDEISSEQFLDNLGSLGIHQTKAVIQEIRNRDDMGSCSYSKLIKALCTPDDPLINEMNNSQPQPIRTQNNSNNNNSSPSRKSVAVFNLPPSLRDTDVLTWKDDPKKGRPISKAIQHKKVVVDKVIKTPARYQHDVATGNIPPEVAALQQERTFAAAREFIDGNVSGVEFRTCLRESGIDINHDLERIIAGHERDGKLRFREFVKYLEIYLTGDVRYTYKTEEIRVPKATLSLSHDPTRPSTASSPKRHSYPTTQEQDILTWSKEPGVEPRLQSIKTFQNITTNSGDFILWEPDPSKDTTSSPSLRASIAKPRKHFPIHNQSKADTLQWHDYPSSQSPDNGTHNSTSPQKTRRPKTANTQSVPNLLTWSDHDSMDSTIGNGTTQAPRSPFNSSIRMMQSPDKTHAFAPGVGIHPKAPFGTERDVHYNINPHRPNGERGGVSVHYK